MLLARYWADARYGAPSQFTLDQFKGGALGGVVLAVSRGEADAPLGMLPDRDFWSAMSERVAAI
jgi:hypothetical protein